ncbi:MAG: hypothetical protein AAFV29_13205, partial [Myxococcota bacterium]
MRALFALMLAANVGCIVVETEIPSVCLTERDIVVTVPMDIVEAALPNILGVPSIPPGFLDADIMSIMT